MKEVLVTEMNFEEKGYLSANPDVREAIKRGLFASGREHFDRFGKAERRTMYVRASPEETSDLGLIHVSERLKGLKQEEAIRVRFFTAYDYCNYACEYCIVGQNNKHSIHHDFDPERYFKIVDAITRLPFPIEIRLGVAGEFFLSKPLVEGGRVLSNAPNTKYLNLITNLSFELDAFRDMLRGYDHSKLALVASYHPTQVEDSKNWLETAVSMSREYDFAVVLIAYPGYLNKLPEMVETFRGAGLTTFVQGFIGMYQQKEYPCAYSAEERELLKKVMYSRHDYEFFINAKRPGMCNAGFKSLDINEDGDVLSCGMGRGVRLGNLLESPDFFFFERFRPCHHDTCMCDTENMNTLSFDQYYEIDGKNQHKYTYRYKDLAEKVKDLDEWRIAY